MSDNIKVKGNGVTSASVAGVKYEADADGNFEMPHEHFVELKNHGFSLATQPDPLVAQDQPEPGTLKEGDLLVGSEKQPAAFELEDGSILQIHAVVLRAFKLSGAVSAKEWNELEPADREEFIAEVVKTLPVKASEA